MSLLLKCVLYKYGVYKIPESILRRVKKSYSAFHHAFTAIPNCLLSREYVLSIQVWRTLYRSARIFDGVFLKKRSLHTSS